jgi:alpha-glucosidase
MKKIVFAFVLLFNACLVFGQVELKPLKNVLKNTEKKEIKHNHWWQHTTIYQIYPRSFFDSNGDGIGDINGITKKLDYIQELGFETIWISPFFASPQADFGYDIKDYQAISPEYGTMSDVESLIEEVHKRKMKIVFDMVMNHTSDQHEWFLESKQNKENDKSDWYIWRDKKNNWKSMVGGSAWQYSEERKQYYLASFLPFQPDLNYRNKEVKKAMFENVRFWLEKGVDGYRLDIFNVIYKNESFEKNPFTFQIFPNETNPLGGFQKATNSLNQKETIEFARELRNETSQFGDKLLLGEVSGPMETIKSYMGAETNDGLGLVFIFEMLDFKFSADYFKNLITKIEQQFPKPFMPVYTFSNHDRRRANSRLKNEQEKTQLLHLLQFTVRGVPCTYYGEEIGMEDAKIPYKKGLDPLAQKYKRIPRFIPELKNETLNRDELRTPMQWSNEKNAGFSSAEKTWLPVNSNYTTCNVDALSKDKLNMLYHFKNLLKLRNGNNILRFGDLQIVEIPNAKNVLAYRRILNRESVLVLINFSNKKVNLSEEITKGEILYKLKNSDFKSLDAFGALVISRK